MSTAQTDCNVLAICLHLKIRLQVFVNLRMTVVSVSQTVIVVSHQDICEITTKVLNLWATS